MAEKIKLWFMVWSIGLVGGILFWILRIFGRIKATGYRMSKFNPGDRGLVLVSNHPSLWEPALLPFLFFPWYLPSLKAVPFSTPDKENYYQKAWFLFLRPVCIPIERGNRRKELATLGRLRKMVEQGKILILFPEGGRTFKGEEFKFSQSGEKMRRFPAGIRKLFLDTNCRILPVWTRGGDKIIPNRPGFPGATEFLAGLLRLYQKVEITIGELIEANDLPKEKGKIIEYLEDALLSLVDQM